MKKYLFIVVVIVFGMLNVDAQEAQYGVTVGFLNVNAKAEYIGQSATASESGFYFGGVADFTISEKLHIQPEVVFASTGDNSGDAIVIPIMGKYYLSDQFNIQAGPHFDFSLEKVPEDYTGFGFSFGAGLGYDIDENFFVEGRFIFQINDYYTGPVDIDTSTNLLMIGIGYKLD